MKSDTLSSMIKFIPTSLILMSAIALTTPGNAQQIIYPPGYGANSYQEEDPEGHESHGSQAAQSNDDEEGDENHEGHERSAIASPITNPINLPSVTNLPEWMDHKNTNHIYPKSGIDNDAIYNRSPE